MDPSTTVIAGFFQLIMQELEGEKMVNKPIKDDETPRLIINPGTAPSEVIADLLSNISIVYRNVGGSGIDFTPLFLESFVEETSEI